MKKYFINISNNEENTIGLAELEDPLITLGIAKSREEVTDIINDFDVNQNGKLEFDEFLDILNGKSQKKDRKNTNRKNNTAILEFFRSKYQ